MLRKPLTPWQMALALLVVAIGCGVGIWCFFNTSALKRPAQRPGADWANAFTGLRSLRVNVWAPHTGADVSSPVSSGALFQKRRLYRSPPSPSVVPIRSIDTLPQYMVSERLVQDMQMTVANSVGAAGLSLKEMPGGPMVGNDEEAQSSPAPVDMSMSTPKPPEDESQTGELMVSTDTHKDKEGVWVETKLTLQRWQLYLKSDGTEMISAPVSLFESRRGPDLYKEADVEKAISAQVNACTEDFLYAYRAGNFRRPRRRSNSEP